jgi:hypothetical protein
MALEFIQPLKEITTRRYFWDKAQSERKADNLTAICEQTF